MAAPAAVLSILVKANTGPATTGLMRINSQLDATDKKAQSVAKSISKVALVTGALGGAAVVGGLVYATRKAADFESQMSSLGAVSDATGKQMEQFRKQALKAGADTKFSALEAAAAQTELAKGGLSVRQIMKGGLRSALALAAAGEMELADAAEATVNAMKLFGLRGKDAMRVADGFATAANRTTADVSDFALALKAGGSAAKAAGLTFTETTAVLEALAEGGIKGSDAGTSMKAMLTQLAAPTEKQQKMLRKLNLDFFDAEGKMKGVTEISGMLQNKLKGLTEQQRLQAVKTLAGTDGLRALLALYDAGPQKMGKFQRELEKEGTAADVAKKKQDNLKGALENLQGSIETIAIKVGTGLLPVLRDAAEELTDFANDVGKIMDRKDLSVGEKLQKSLDLAQVRAKPWIDKLAAAVEAANLPERIAGLISAAVPIMAEAAAKGSVVVARAFVTGFLAAEVWGRLAVGAWLLARMGGPPAFLKVGTTAGAAMGAGMGAGMATGLAAPGIKSKLAGVAKSWGPTMAIALAAVLGPEVVKAAAKTSPSTGERAKQKFDDVVAGAASFDELRESINKTSAAYDRASEAVGSYNPKQRLAGDNTRRTAEEFNKLAEPVRSAQRLIQNMATGSSQSIRDLRATVNNNTELIKKYLGENTRAGKDALVKHFRAAIANIRTSMAHGKIATREGLKEIERLMAAALQTMGFTPKQALTLVRHQGKNPTSASTIGPGGQIRPRQRGAYISEGKATGDSVPAVLERGEYVLNRNAVKKVGRKALDRLNFAAAPRFQGGGIVELLHPGNDPAGHGDHLHVAMSTYKAVVNLGRRLQQMGWLVGEHPAFGGVQGGHSPTGYHPKGLAIDVNWPLPAEERAKIAALLPMLGGIGPAQVPDIARVSAAGPASPLKSIVQGALDTARASAQKVVESVGSAGAEGIETSNFSGPWTGVMAKIARSRGWSLADWRSLVMKESGGNPNARNPSSGAYGLGQFLGATAQAYAKYGALSPDPVQQIQAMAQYISDRYGSPSSALSFHNSHNWYSKGGAVGFQWGGSPIPQTGFGKAVGAGMQPRKRSQPIGKLIKKYTAAQSPKIRKATMRKILDKAQDLGLPVAMRRALKLHSDNAATFGEFADRAASLTDETAITDVLQAELDRRSGLGLPFPDADQQAIVNEMSGKVGGKGQLDWLKSQLDALFNWRNAIIDAEQRIVRLREKITEAIKIAREQLERVREQLKANYERKRDLEKRIKELNKHPKRNKDRLKVARAALKGLNEHIGIREGVRDNLREKILPALTGKRETLNTARGELLSDLETVQGRGSSMERLTVLPADMGAMGGNIFDTRQRIQELTSKPIRVVAEASTDTGSDRRAELAEEIAAAERRKTALLAAQLPILKDIPRLFGLPAFAQGGIIPGPVDSPRVVLAHGGEGVFTRDQMAALAGGGQPTIVRVIVEDGAVDPKRIRVIADGALNDMGARVGLGLQGLRRAPGDVAGLQ